MADTKGSNRVNCCRSDFTSSAPSIIGVPLGAPPEAPSPILPSHLLLFLLLLLLLLHGEMLGYDLLELLHPVISKEGSAYVKLLEVHVILC